MQPGTWSSRTRNLVALGFFGCATMALMPLGCGSRIESPALKDWAPSEGPHAPNTIIVRLRECVEEYGPDLPGLNFRFNYKVQIDENGRALHVKSDVFHADLDGCTKMALRAMQISPEVLAPWLSQPIAQGNGQTKGARGVVGNVIILGMAIALGDIIINAGGITVIIAISLAMAEDVVEAIRRRPRPEPDEEKSCTQHLSDCLMSDVASKKGSVWKHTLCRSCFERCRDGEWPASINLAGRTESCYYGPVNEW